MQLTNSPVKIPLPFASSGLKNAIPEASQIGITAGAASLTDGFPPLTRTPLAAGGIPVAPGDMNGILYELSSVIRWANAGGGYAYDGTFAADANVGGYPKGARIMCSDGLGYWFNTVENNVTDPEGVGAIAAGWLPDFTPGATLVTMTSTNVTLTALQYGKSIVIISGLLTANLNLIFPNITGRWTVINNTTGTFTITCKTAVGAGVVVVGALQIVGDGTNILAANTFTNFPTIVGLCRNLKLSVLTASVIASLTADEIVVKNVLGGNSFQLSSFNKAINLSTTGAGGMDTGTAPVSGYVALYAIYNPTTSVSALLGVNATSVVVPNIYGGANMPAGYTASALVSVWPTNSSSQFKAGVQNDRQIQFAGIQVLSTTSWTSAVLSISGAVPKNAIAVNGRFGLSTTSGTAGSAILQVSGDSSQFGMQWFQASVISGIGINSVFNNLLLTTPQSLYYVSNAGVGTTSFGIDIISYSF